MRIRYSGCLLSLAASLFLLGPWLPPASSQLLGPEFQVNTYTTGHQKTPSVAADALGNFVVVWEGNGQDGSFYGVFGQRYDLAGSPSGSEFQINSYTTGGQSSPGVAAQGLGNFVVVWASQGQDGSGSGVFGQRYDPAGTPIGTEFQINTYTTGYQVFPAVAADGSGNFIVAWTSDSQDGSSYGVFGQRFNSAGAPIGSEFQVNTFTTGYQRLPAVAADALGNFVVAWDSTSQDGSNRGVFGQRFDSVGTAMGSEFQVNSYTTGSQYDLATAADDSGNFVVVWTSNGQDGASLGVFGQRYDLAGSPLGSEFQVNSHTPANQRFPTVSAVASGDFVVAWMSHAQDGSSYGVFGQRFNSAGGPVGSEFQVNSYTINAQSTPAASADASGNFVLTWMSTGQDGASDGVFGRRLTFSFFSDGFELGDACAWSAAVGGGC